MNHRKFPSLKEKSPLIYFIVPGFVVTNILISISLFNGRIGNIPYIIVRGVFTLDFWATVFLAVGVLHLIGLVLNHWTIIRTGLILGLVVDALWLYALILKGGVIGIGVWAFIFYIQLLELIFFPTEKKTNGTIR